MERLNNMVSDAIIKIFSQEFVPAGTVLVNRNGTAKKSQKCSNCGPWIKHWETLSEQDAPSAGDCAVVGCTGRTKGGKLAEIEGCHVMIKDSDDKRVFIAPLCKCCNNKADGTELKLSRGITLVWANMQETCGKLTEGNMP